MAMSLPSPAWISSDVSGERNIGEPFRWFWKRTPSSLIRRNRASDHTWNPPESVSSGRGQAMKSCSPPKRAITSAPGRRKRW